MPVNYLAIQSQIREMGQQASQLKLQRDERYQKAVSLLREHANQLDELSALAEQAVSQSQYLRLAGPLTDALDAVFSPSASQPVAPVILAIDGSQITPNKHESVEFGLVNIGLFRFLPDQPADSGGSVSSRLLYERHASKDNEALSEEKVNLIRDLNEREELVVQALKEQLPVVALTDGQLEIFREPDNDQLFDDAFKSYLGQLESLSYRQAALAGYVDRPRADLLVRLLELAMIAKKDPAVENQDRPLRGVSDDALFSGLLRPGQRSAVFALRSRKADRYARHCPDGRLGLTFFYLNTGRPGRPAIVRVEAPAWVTREPALLSQLHVTLLDQCACMGNQPYPYALHRAHEIALVSYDDKEQLSRMILTELLSQGFSPDGPSNKQGNKDLAYQARRSTL